MCRVNGCQEQHSNHYCKVCQHSDSSHFASSCPNSMTVYHGTHKKNIKSIKQNGFRLSTQGRIGEGVYFTPNYKVAKKIAINRFGQHQWAVIECKIPSFNQSYKDSYPHKQKLITSAKGMIQGIPLIASNTIIGSIGLAFGAIMAIDSLWQWHKESKHNERIDDQKQQIKHYNVHGSGYDKIPYEFKGVCVRRKMVKNIKIVKVTKYDD